MARNSRAPANVTDQTAQAILRLLEAIAPAALRACVTPQTIAQLAKHALVQAAAAEARMRNGRVNRSRVAAMTGLSRHEVAAFLASERPSVDTAAALPAQRVAQGWSTDPEFLRADGAPRVLRVTQAANAPLARLIRRYGNDVPVVPVLAEMKRLGLVKIEGRNATLLGTTPTIAQRRPIVARHQIPVANDKQRQLVRRRAIETLDAACSALTATRAPQGARETESKKGIEVLTIVLD